MRLGGGEGEYHSPGDFQGPQPPPGQLVDKCNYLVVGHELRDAIAAKDQVFVVICQLPLRGMNYRGLKSLHGSKSRCASSSCAEFLAKCSRTRTPEIVSGPCAPSKNELQFAAGQGYLPLHIIDTVRWGSQLLGCRATHHITPHHRGTFTCPTVKGPEIAMQPNHLGQLTPKFIFHVPPHFASVPRALPFSPAAFHTADQHAAPHLLDFRLGVHADRGSYVVPK